MQRARISRVTSIAGTAALILGLLPGVASAALPSADPTQRSLLAEYSAGNDAGFEGTLKSTDTSTLPRLYLAVDTVGVAALSYVRATINGAVVANACDKPGDPLPVDCLFRRVRPGDLVRVVIGVTPEVTASGVAVHYTWSTTGAGSGSGDNSHGDTWEVVDTAGGDVYSTSTLNGSGDYAGGFNESAIETTLAVSRSNPQAARLSNLPAAVPSSVRDTLADGSSALLTCVDSAEIDCDQLVGDWVEVNVGEGQTFGSVFVIDIVYYQGNPKFFVHSYLDEGNQVQQEYVGPCPRRNPASSAPCFTWKASTGTATIYTYFNGGWRG